MPFIGSIQAALSADTADFKTKMAEAGQSVEHFDKQVKKFGLGFGGVAALATAFRAIVDYARDLENPLDENIKRAKAFALGLDEAKKSTLDVGAEVLGVVNGLGEWWGKQIAIIKNGRVQAETAERIQKQTEETLAAIEKDKKLTQEIGELHKQTAEIEKKRGEEADKRLTTEEQESLAVQRFLDAQRNVIAAQGNKLETAKAELKLAQARADLEKATAELEKKRAEDAKQTNEARQEDDKDHVETLQKIAKLRFDALPLEEKILTVEESIRSVTELIAAKKRDGKDVDEETLILMENQNDLAKLREKQAEGQAKAEKKVTKEIKSQNDALRVGFEIRGRYNEDLSDRALEDKIATLTTDIARRRERAQHSAYDPYDPLASFQEQQLNAARGELDARNRIRSLVAQYGEEGAARFYRGNMPEFERLLQYINPDEMKKQTSLLDEVNRRMQQSGFFPLK